MSDKAKEKSDSDQRFRLLDFLIILLCLSGALFFVNLFRIDLFNTLDSKNEKPVGTIIVKNNVVQRRMANRVLWDRLIVDSPAYMGDLIRTADISSATLHIENTSLELGERTLIRIQRSLDGEGLIQINLEEGNLGLTAGDGGILLNLMGRSVRVEPGTILNTTATRDGTVVQVNRGAAAFIDSGQRREITAGARVAFDVDGGERTEKAAVAIHPLPNARYLKNGEDPLHINFSWNSMNLDPDERLRLEIAEDRNFKRIVQVIENLSAAAGGDAVGVDLDAGVWYWRLSSMDPNSSNRVISTERFTITEATGPALLSPVTDSFFRYQNDLPQLRFQWPQVEGAVSYILEVSENPDFTDTRLRTQTSSVFLLDSSLGEGTWYWRVIPVFPSIYEGTAAFSPASSFRIEQGATEALVMPQVIPEPVAQPVPVNLSLLSPAPQASLPGLTALRQQTVFTWDSDGEITSSRFILSRNSDPLQGRPVTEINNPDRSVRLNRLEEGVYYWTVTAQSTDGLISSAVPRQLRIMPIPLLPAPLNLRPSEGSVIGIDELKTQTSIAFTWAAVQGANAYVFTLYRENVNGQRIINRPPENITRWTLENLSTLGRGTFVWQVEAVNRNSAGTIEQRGRIGEGTFTLDVPAPGTVHIEDPGILYGF